MVFCRCWILDYILKVSENDFIKERLLLKEIYNFMYNLMDEKILNNNLLLGKVG